MAQSPSLIVTHVTDETRPDSKPAVRRLGSNECSRRNCGNEPVTPASALMAPWRPVVGVCDMQDVGRRHAEIGYFGLGGVCGIWL